eukprot:7218024-Pyramimonas_sp.AAC.1
MGRQSTHNHSLLQLGHTSEQLLHAGRLQIPSGLWASPGHLLSACGVQSGLQFQHVSSMDIVLLLLEADRAPDLDILGPPLLEAFDLGRVNVLSVGFGTSRSSSSLSSCLISSVYEAGCSTISSSSPAAGIEGCQSPEATAERWNPSRSGESFNS